jgi:hypothetical protein
MNTKKLLTTTALVSLFASGALADGMAERPNLDIKFAGVADVQMGFNMQESKYKNTTASLTPNNEDIAFDSKAYLSLEASGKTAKGLKYGAHLGLAPTVLFTTNSSNHYLNRSYIFVEDKDIGRLEFGSNESASDQMFLDAGSIAAAAGGVRGDWIKYVHIVSAGATNTTATGDFIVNPAMPLENELYVQALNAQSASTFNAVREKARKISYFSPKFEGFQLGVSFIPDIRNTAGLASVINTNSSATAITMQEENAIAAGISWGGKVATDHKLKVSVVGEYGKVKIPVAGTGVEDTKAIALGGTWNYKQFAAAASGGYLGRTDYYKTTTAAYTALRKDAWFATLGAGMEFDKFYATVTGMYSTKNDNKAYLVSGGIEYNLAPGLLPYAEVTYMNLDGKNTGLTNPATGTAGTTTLLASTTLKSTGTAFILGTKVKF